MSTSSDNDSITIHWTEGSAPHTDHVPAANVVTHIAAGDHLATEAMILQACMHAPERPVAWKFTDPTEEARLIYDDDEAWAVIDEDPSLIVWIFHED